MPSRNRAEGWQHAKITGHSNEELAKEYVECDVNVQKRLLECYGATDAEIECVEIGGLHELSVDSVLGDKTKSKPDMHVVLKDGRHIKVSIKKSIGGQVFLITPSRFIEGFEKVFNKTIPDEVKTGIELYWGTHPDTEKIARQIAGVNMEYELRKGRLVHETLAQYNPHMDSALLDWFNDNIVEIFEFCFTKGLAKNPEDWADVIWYVNLVDDDENIDEMFTISKIMHNLKKLPVEYGNRNGGSTIQLPFGFVQWHDPGNKGNKNLQFHHKYDKIIELLCERNLKTNKRENTLEPLKHLYIENHQMKRYEIPDGDDYAMVAEYSEENHWDGYAIHGKSSV